MIPVLQWRYASGQTEEKGCKSCRAQDGTADLDQGRSARFEGALQGEDARDNYLQRDEAHCRGSSPAGAETRNQPGSPALTACRRPSGTAVRGPWPDDGHEHGAALSEQRQLDELAFERPVEIPLVVVLMLEVTRQLAGIGIERHRRIRVERFVGNAGRTDRVAQRSGVVRLGGTEEREIQLGVVASGDPHRGAVALMARQLVLWTLDGLGNITVRTVFFLSSATLTVQRRKSGAQFENAESIITRSASFTALKCAAERSTSSQPISSRKSSSVADK